MVAVRRYVLRYLQRFAIFLIEEVPVWLYALLFLAVVLIWAAAYYWLSALGHGLAGIGETEGYRFSDALYFSVVTVSSLGYGDMRPVGFSRCLACGEVLFGLFTMGIIVAKATSFRLSYHVERLFANSIHDQMQRFIQEFEKLAIELQAIHKMISSSFDVPNKDTSRSQHTVGVRFEQAVELLLAHSAGVAECIALEELDYARFFQLAPSKIVERTASSMDEVFFALGTMMQFMGPNAKQTLLNSDNRSLIQKARERIIAIHEIVDAHCPVGKARENFKRLHDTCQSMPDKYFAVPAVRPSQPNLQPAADEPEA